MQKGLIYIVILNPDINKVRYVKEAISNNDGYCPCKLLKNEDTKCICSEFRNQSYSGECHCGLYIKLIKD